MDRLWAVLVACCLGLTACDSIEDKAVDAYRECATEYGLDAGMIGIVQGPDGGYAITGSDLPEPAATECLARASDVLRGD